MRTLLRHKPAPEHSASMLRSLKKLQHALQKFNSSRKYTTAKTNILRLVLLPYLRQTPACTNERLVLLSASILLKWWPALLTAVEDHYHQLASLDKNCYLECVSRIVSRDEWPALAKGDHPSYTQKHGTLLLRTLEMAISRLSVKHTSMSVCAFAGKIFAYAYFLLPDVARGLSFLLNTKVRDYALVYDVCVRNKTPIDTRSNLDRDKLDSALASISPLFPAYMHSLLAAEPRQTRFRIEKGFLNAITPPQQKIAGINETRGLWCQRWASLDNVDLFCSFLRHYLEIAGSYIGDTKLDSLHTFVLPGFVCILTHVFEIFDFQVHQRVLQKQQQQQNQQLVNASASSLSFCAAGVSLQLPSTAPSEKLFRVLRDFLTNGLQQKLFAGVAKAFENVLKLLVCRTKLFETLMVDQVFELFVRYLRSIRVQTALVDWPFWSDVCMKLLESKSIRCELRALAVIYRCWDFIPADHRYDLALRLVGDRCWAAFFGHYMPLVRAFYTRLLVWKILGLDWVGLSEKKSLSFKNSLKRAKLIKEISAKLAQTFSQTRDFLFNPEDPVLNRRIVIKKNDTDATGSSSTEIRTLPYEILDDAAYSCAKLLVSEHSSPEQSPSSSTTDLCTLRNSESSESGAIRRSGTLTKKSHSETDTTATAATAVSVSVKLASSWVGKLFRKLPKKESSLANVSYSSLDSTDSDEDYSSERSDRFDPRALPPRFGMDARSSSSPSLSSKSSSSPSLLSSIGSSSSPQSSASSLDYLDQFTSSSEYIRSIRGMQGRKSLRFVPPELNFSIPELGAPQYHFQMVANELKMSTSYQSLRDLNSQPQRRFVPDSAACVANSAPRLPSLDRQLDSDLDSDINLGIDVMAGEPSTIESTLRLDSRGSVNTASSAASSSSSSSASSSSNSSTIYFSAKNTQNTSTSNQPHKQGYLRSVQRSPAQFANAVFEYNACVAEFEHFMLARLAECRRRQQLRANNRRSLFRKSGVFASQDSSFLLGDFAGQLDQDIPVLTAEDNGAY